jgi:TPR repeat protein
MDPVAWRRACVEFRLKLSRDTGVNLTAAFCDRLFDSTFTYEGGEQATLESNPGGFYSCLGAAIADGRRVLGVPEYMQAACWCFREAAEVHKHPEGMDRLGDCLYRGRGVTEDPVQAVVWYQKAADLGDASAKNHLGRMLVIGDARAGVAKDAARGFGLLREAVAQGNGPASFQVACCYLYGEGVEKDAVHGVSLLRQVITQQEGSTKGMAQCTLSVCYLEGDGVEADTVQAALWCQRAAAGGNEDAIRNLPIIRECNFCGKTPTHQLCARCEKVRYCGRRCQLVHWNRETDTHKGHCRRRVPRRAAEASDEDGASSPRAS